MCAALYGICRSMDATRPEMTKFGHRFGALHSTCKLLANYSAPRGV